MPDALWFATGTGWDDFDSYDPDVVHAYWDATAAFKFGDGYAKLGWNPDEMPIEAWLQDQILAFVVREYGETYASMVGRSPIIAPHSSILRLPTSEESISRLRQ
jgi:hypothetical protein